MDSMKTLAIGILLGALAPGMHAQATGAAQQVRKSAEQAVAQASGQGAKPAAKPANQGAPANAPNAKPAPGARPQANPQGQAPARPAPTNARPGIGAGARPPVAKAATPQPKPAGAKPPMAESARGNGLGKRPAVKRPPKPMIEAENLEQPKVARRDPFEAMIGHEQTATVGTRVLPPGIRGLQVSTVRLDGVVRGPNGMIAVVSNPQSRTYFLREGDELYDGKVEKIAMDGVSFHETGKDAFGKPVEREVSKRLYASAGEQQ
jgi:Tfp pilus assembly protein PilP